MKALALASLIAASAGTGVAVGGPIFFGYTVPFAMHQQGRNTAGGIVWQSIPYNPQFGHEASLSLGVATDNLVITDVSFASSEAQSRRRSVWIGGQPAFEWVAKFSTQGGGYHDQSLHLQHGIPVPAGTTIEVRETTNGTGQAPGHSVSLSGYVIF